MNSSQALRYSGRQLPDWGFNQMEIVTDKTVIQDDTIWNVEEHRYTKCKFTVFFLVHLNNHLMDKCH